MSGLFNSSQWSSKCSPYVSRNNAQLKRAVNGQIANSCPTGETYAVQATQICCPLAVSTLYSVWDGIVSNNNSSDSSSPQYFVAWLNSLNPTSEIITITITNVTNDDMNYTYTYTYVLNGTTYTCSYTTAYITIDYVVGYSYTVYPSGLYKGQYPSSDGSLTFLSPLETNQQCPNLKIVGCAISTDANVIACTCYNNNSTSFVYYSTDGGISWTNTEMTGLSSYYNSVACNSDGSYVAAASRSATAANVSGIYLINTSTGIVTTISMPTDMTAAGILMNESSTGIILTNGSSVYTFDTSTPSTLTANTTGLNYLQAGSTTYDTSRLLLNSLNSNLFSIISTGTLNNNFTEIMPTDAQYITSLAMNNNGTYAACISSNYGIYLLYTGIYDSTNNVYTWTNQTIPYSPTCIKSPAMMYLTMDNIGNVYLAIGEFILQAFINTTTNTYMWNTPISFFDRTKIIL